MADLSNLWYWNCRSCGLVVRQSLVGWRALLIGVAGTASVANQPLADLEDLPASNVKPYLYIHKLPGI